MIGAIQTDAFDISLADCLPVMCMLSSCLRGSPLGSCLHPGQLLDEVRPKEVPEEASCQCTAACHAPRCASPHHLPCLQLPGPLQRAGQTGARACQRCLAGRPWAMAGSPWAGACWCWLRRPAWRPAQMLPCGEDRLLQAKPLCPPAAPLPHDFPETLHSNAALPITSLFPSSPRLGQLSSVPWGDSQY